eukprot:1061565-Rhodomonas_salina.1
MASLSPMNAAYKPRWPAPSTAPHQLQQPDSQVAVECKRLHKRIQHRQTDFQRGACGGRGVTIHKFPFALRADAGFLSDLEQLLDHVSVLAHPVLFRLEQSVGGQGRAQHTHLSRRQDAHILSQPSLDAET